MRDRIVLMVLAAATTAGCGGDEPGRVPPEPSLEVTVSPIAVGPTTVTFPARVVSADAAELSTRVSGAVRAIRVGVGDSVQQGELLVELESGDVLAALESARAQAVLASKSFDRIASLEKDGAATPQELDEAEARLRSAQGAIEQAATQLGYVHIVAPFDGIVTVRAVDPGDLVVPGKTILEIASTAVLEIEADLPATQASTIEPGMAAVVVDPQTEARAAARVTRVVPSLDRASYRFRVEAEFLDDPPLALLPGQFARLEIEAAGQRTRWAPADAVVRRGQMTGVYVVENDTTRIRWVRLGREREGGVELLAGVGRDSRIVRRPAPGLSDGQRVARIEVEPWWVDDE